MAVVLLVMLRFWKVRTVAWLAAVLAAGFLVSRLRLVLDGASLARLYTGRTPGPVSCCSGAPWPWCSPPSPLVPGSTPLWTGGPTARPAWPHGS
ncbi:hypothetical protein [Pseudarthrobacter sp. TAF60_1]|uniref:hypothetical protein n=1 Tax=Pseudarthrobacter sp. TAF60_1 TaxID=3233071 RepID=UPI003F9C7AE5